MMGYRFMARLRCYYTSSAVRRGGAEEEEKENGMQAASRRIWFSVSRKRACLVRWESTERKGSCAKREAKGGFPETKGMKEWKGRRIVLWTADLAIVDIMKPRRDFSLFSCT